MNGKLWENSGRKIKIIASVFQIFATVCGVFAAFAIDEILLSVGAFVGIAISAWLIAIFMYAFGELCENIQKISEQGVTAKADEKRSLIKSEPRTVKRLKCPKCGTSNPMGSVKCAGCGVKFSMGKGSEE